MEELTASTGCQLAGGRRPSKLERGLEEGVEEGKEGKRERINTYQCVTSNYS